MKKINLTIGALLLGSVLFASNFVACGGGDSGTTGLAGTTGAAGQNTAGTTGAAGTGTDGGAAGTGSANVDGGNATLADGKCVSGAFKRDGVCSCQGDSPNVCGDACTNVKSDNDNCGACGVKCTGTSACNNGTCGPQATNVLPKVAGCGELTIAVSGGKIYYANKTGNSVSSVATTGGAATVISSTEKAPTAIAVSGTNILWINNVAGAPVDGGATVTSTIRKSAAGAAPTDVVTATAPGGGIRGFVASADGNTIYYSTGTFVKAVPIAGGASTAVAVEEHGGIPGALALEGTKLAYPTDLNGDVDIVTIMPGVEARCGKEDDTKPTGYDMLNCVRIARSQGSLKKELMMAFGGWAYWIDNPSIKAGELAPPGTPANDQVGSTMFAIQGMTTNKTNIYFTDADTNAPTAPNGTIWKTGINKAQLTSQVPLARGQVSPGSIALDATKVYWAADCAINATGL